MKLVHKYPVLGSSQNPEKLKMRIQSVGVALIPLTIFVLRMVGLDDVNETELIGLVDLMSKFAMLATSLWAVGLQIWGWVRKFRN